MRNDCFIVISLFSGWPIACEMGVPKVFIVIILSAGRPIVCEMGVPKVLSSRILFAASPCLPHVKWMLLKIL